MRGAIRPHSDDMDLDLGDRTAELRCHGSNRGIGKRDPRGARAGAAGPAARGHALAGEVRGAPVTRAKEVRPVRMDLASREAIDES